MANRSTFSNLPLFLFNLHPEAYKEFLPLKTLQLVKDTSRVVRYDHIPMLNSAKVPIQVVYDRNKVWRQLQGIWKRQKLSEEDILSLTDFHMEVACQEYLRLQGDIDVLLERIGLSTQDVDIVGLDRQRNRVFVQVTQATKPKDIRDKADKLTRYADNNHCIFCAPHATRGIVAPFSKRYKHYRFIATEEILGKLIKDRTSVQYEMVRRMVNPWQFIE